MNEWAEMDLLCESNELYLVIGVGPFSHPLGCLIVYTRVQLHVQAVLHLIEHFPQRQIVVVRRAMEVAVLVVEAALTEPSCYAAVVLAYLLARRVHQPAARIVAPVDLVRIVRRIVVLTVLLPQPSRRRAQIEGWLEACSGGEEVDDDGVEVREVPVRVVLRRVARYLHCQPIAVLLPGTRIAEQCRTGRYGTAGLSHTQSTDHIERRCSVARLVGYEATTHTGGRTERCELHLINHTTTALTRQLGLVLHSHITTL